MILARVEKRLGTANGTLLLVLSLVVVKIIGGLYKIPLYNMLGGYGIGLYQSVFPVYALLLAISGGGISSGITTLISRGYNAKSTLKKCVFLFLPLGLIFNLILFFLGDLIANLQGNIYGGSLFKIISFALAPVCLISCLRGYFQGKSNFIPSAFSQVIEQLVKCVSGVIALLLCDGDAIIKAFWACFAVTLSEVLTLIFLAVVYLTVCKKKGKAEEQCDTPKEPKSKEIISFIAPLILSSLCLPLASFADSFIVINSLKGIYGESAVSVYGVYTGGVDTLINLPVSLLNAFSLGFLPKISNSESAGKSVFYVFLLALAGTLGVIFISPIAVKILFGASSEYNSLAISLLQKASVCIILHALLHAINGVLLAMGKQKISLLSLFLGVAVKIIIDITLIKIPSINIFGMVISDVGCYFVALIFNLLYNIYNKNIFLGKQNENNLSRIRRRRKFSFRKSSAGN